MGLNGEDGYLLKMGGYAMVIVKALTKARSKERKCFAIVVRLLAFGTKKSQLAEGVIDAEDYSCLAMAEHVPIEAGFDAEEKEAFKIMDKNGQQFMNIKRMGIELIHSFGVIAF